jgi:two-component system cell cycle sensor histidine kinase/response regulator CckA
MRPMRAVPPALPMPEPEPLEADARLRSFLDAALDAVVVVDDRGRIAEFNRAAERMFGRDAATVIGCPMAELLIPPRLRDAHDSGFRGAVLNGGGRLLGRRLELPALRADGSEFPVELGLARIDSGGRPMFAAFLRDLSGARRVEDDLRQAEERNRKLVEQLPLVTYIEQLDHASASYISPQIEALVGYTAEEWMSDPNFFGKVLHPDDRDRVLADFAGMHSSRERMDSEYRIIARDGRHIWIHDGAVVVHDDLTGRPLYAQGFMVDITDRKETEEALRDSEQRVRDLLAGIDVIVWDADPDFNFSFVSQRAEDILGYPVEQWLATPAFIVEHFHPDDRERVIALDRAAIATGEDYELEYRILAADGRPLWFREIVRVETDESGRATRLRGVMVDVTAQKRGEEAQTALEHQLRQAQKMEAVGRLAGGIAHDFNNLLTAISGYTNLALGRLGDGDAETRSDLSQIDLASGQAASLTQQLLAFSRQQVMSPKVLDLNEVVGTVDKLLRRLIGEDIELSTSTFGEELPVEADPAALEQVLINLAINARDAMPNGGTLSIDTSRHEIDAAVAGAIQDARPGAYAVVSVIDTGHGIDGEAKPHLFEPFFTTKDIGKGTGLGLATVYGTVQQSDGFITVDSEPGHGAAFHVFLPLSVRSSAPSGDDAQSRVPDGGSETILLVEDAEVVRDLTSKALELEGYRVVAAATPAEALVLADEVYYELLLTDVVMPQMRGGELARQLSAKRPGLKVLFMSGYLDGEALLGEEAPTAFLQKPFRLDELGATVRELLDS